MSFVFVVDTDHRPLDPVHPGHARRLLSRGQAAVWRRYPFTLILKRAVPDAQPQPLRLKIDPGSRTTGLALVTESVTAPAAKQERAEEESAGHVGWVVWAAELTHRGQAVHEQVVARAAQRRSRRAHHTRYRPQRFNNRRRSQGWLPPSLESRLANTETWVARLCRLANITAISQELVKFDTQALQNPEIAGVEYQQGTLAGYELREYLLEKWGRKCSYCGKANIPLQVEHIVPKAKYRDDRVSNLCLACGKCNSAKGVKDIRDFLKKKPDLLKKILEQAKAPFKEAAAVNTTRWALFERLKALGLPIE